MALAAKQVGSSCLPSLPSAALSQESWGPIFLLFLSGVSSTLTFLILCSLCFASVSHLGAHVTLILAGSRSPGGDLTLGQCTDCKNVQSLLVNFRLSGSWAAVFLEFSLLVDDAGSCTKSGSCWRGSLLMMPSALLRVIPGKPLYSLPRQEPNGAL